MAGYAWVTAVGWTLVAVGVLGAIAWITGCSGRGLRRCPRCDYDMSAIAGLMCPECGRSAKHERALHRRRRSRAWRRGAITLLVLGAGSLVFNPGRGDGWAASVPNWAVWPVMAWFDWQADAAVARLSAGFSPGTRQDPTHWERLLIAQRCRTIVAKVDALARRPRAERTPSFDPSIKAALENSANEAEARAALASLRKVADPIDGAKDDFHGLIDFAREERSLVAPALGRLLRTALAERDDRTLWWAMGQLRRVGAVDRATARLLVSLTRDPDGRIRIYALGTLVETGSFRSGALVGELTAALDDADPVMRLYAAGWLGKLAAKAEPALARLRTVSANDNDQWVRAAAANAVEIIQAAK